MNRASSQPAAPGAASRVAGADILPLFTERWSPRSFTDEAIRVDQLEQLLEAARWAPSSHNVQPWRFLYSLRGDAQWATFASLPNERNQSWCHKAAALLLVVSDSASRTHTFDAGCAWGYLALQAQALGWSAHGMAGFDAERARTALGVPDAFTVQAMIAIGRRGPAEALPEALREREQPSQRLPLSAIAWPGRFPTPSSASADGAP